MDCTQAASSVQVDVVGMHVDWLLWQQASIRHVHVCPEVHAWGCTPVEPVTTAIVLVCVACKHSHKSCTPGSSIH